MTRWPIRQVRALLLAIVFAGGSFGVSGLDAALFHRSAARILGPHYELPGGCGAHSERCVLGTSFIEQQLPTGGATPALVPLAHFVVPAPVEPGAPVIGRARRLPLSRAPPLLSARG